MADHRGSSYISEESKSDFYKLCFENSMDIIFLIDKTYTIKCVSPSVFNILGYIPDDFIDMPIFDTKILSLWSIDDFARDLDVLFKGMVLSNIEYEFISRRGKNLILEINGTPLNEDGNIERAIISARDITNRKQTEEELQRSLQSLRKSLDVIIKTISRTVESRDPYTAGHQRRVSDLARSIGEELGLTDDIVDGIRMSGAVHDVGKITVPTEILSKPGRLHTAEFELIKIHPILGFDILSTIDFPWPVAATVLQHHERNDGSGYPYGIKDSNIIIEAKIIGVADVVEAVATHRPYRASLGIEEALEEIEEYKDIKYDAEVVDACVHLFRNQGYNLL